MATARRDPTGRPAIPQLTSFGGDSMDSLAQSNDFARVHDVERIKRFLDCPHRLERRRAMLAQKILHLALPDSVLAGAGSIHGQGPLDQPLVERLGDLDLVG